MKIASALLIVLGMVLGLCGCGDSKKLSSSPVASSSDQGNFTIMLKSFSQPNHLEEASRYKLNTEKHAGWKNLYMETDDDHTALYWGKYATIDDTKKNLSIAWEYTTPVGVKVYSAAMPLPIEKEAQAPPQWDLRRAPGVYTVLVAEFFDVPDRNYYGRKLFAVEYCRQLREEGKRAFYYHDTGQSLVTVGVFPAGAVKQSAPQVVDSEAKGVSIEVAGENSSRRLRPKTITTLVPVDPRMQQIIDEFKYLAVNGRTLNRRAFDPAVETYALGESKKMPSRETFEATRKSASMVPAKPEPIEIPRFTR